jgi:hypothetical protein
LPAGHVDQPVTQPSNAPTTAARRRRRWPLLTAFALLAGCTAAVGVAATGAPSRGPLAPERAGAAAEPASRRPLTAEERRAELARDGQDRVLFVGDSLTFGAVDVLRSTMADHDVDTRFVGHAGTGLLSGQGWWNEGIAERVADFHPDVVVIEACCNYGNDHEPWYRLPDGTEVAPDSPEMFAQWEALAREAVDLARAGGASVYWVVTPDAAPITSAYLLDRMERFGEIYDRLDVPRIDWRGAVQPDGPFAYAVDEGGVSIQLRSLDGLHLADAGNERIAAETWSTISPDLTQR